MGQRKLLKYLNNSFDIKPYGKTGFYVDGKKITPNNAVKSLYELLEDEINEEDRGAITGYVLKASKTDGTEIVDAIRRTYKDRVRASTVGIIGKLDVKKSFQHRGLTPIRDIENGKRGLFDTNKNRISPLDYDTWYDKLPPDREQRSLIMESEILGLVKYDPYTLESLKTTQYEGQEIYQFNSHLPPAWRFYKEDEYYDDPDFFISFLEHLVPSADCRQYVIDWLYTMIFSRNETILVLVSTKGTGKNIFIQICEHLVGKLNFQIHGDDFFASQFSHELLDKRLVAFDECLIKLKYKDKFKRITNNTITVEKKGKDVERGKQNYNSYIVANNVTDGNHIDSDDRRFSVVDITDERLQERFSESEINTFMQALENNPETISSIGRYIVDNFSNSFDSHIPYKGAKFYELRYWSLSLWKRFLVDIIEEKKQEYYTIENLKLEYELRTNQRIWPSNNKIQQFLDVWRDFDGGKIANIDKIEGDNCLKPTDKYAVISQEEIEDDFDL